MNSNIILELVRNNLQSTDNALRTKVEHSLLTLYAKAPDQVLNTYLDIVAIKQESSQKPQNKYTKTQPFYLEQIKQFIFVQLKNCLSRDPPPPYHNIWPNLTITTQERLKENLFTLLVNESDLSIAKVLTSTIGHLAANLIVENASQWPEFRERLLQVFVRYSQLGIYCGFYILQSFYEQQQKHFKNILPQLYDVLQTAFQELQNPALKIAALRCFSAYLLVLEHQHHPHYQVMIPEMLETVSNLIVKHSNTSGLVILAGMIEVEPKFFKPSFQQLVNCFIKLYRLTQLKQSDKKILTQTLIDYCQTYPSLFRKNLEALASLLDMIVMHMLSNENEVTQSWLTPEQGYDEQYSDENEIDTTRFGMNSLNKILRAVGKEETLPHITTIVQKLLTISNWRYTYAGLMIMSQLGEYIDGIESIEPLISTAIEYLSFQNPMLRYAACQTIGQYSQDLKPHFQIKYGKNVYNKLTHLLFTEPAARVQCHIQAALTNFLESASFELIEVQFHQLTCTLLENTKNSISIVKQSALGTMASLVEIAKQHFLPYLSTFFQIIIEYFNREDYQNTCYNKLRGQALQTCTYAAFSLGKQYFRPYLKPLIDIMINLPKVDKYQPPLHFILNSWQRLCATYSIELQEHIDLFLPELFTLIESTIAQSIASRVHSNKLQHFDQDQRQVDGEIKSYETQSIQYGISMLNAFIQQLPSLSNRYLEQTITVYSNIIVKFENEDIKESACKAIPSIIKSITQQEIKVDIAKMFISHLIVSLQANRESLSASAKLKAIHRIIQNFQYPFFSLQQLTILTDKLLYQLQASQKYKQSIFKDSCNLDEDELQNADGELQNQQDIQFCIGQILGDIFKYYQDSSFPLAQQLLNSALLDNFIEAQREAPLKLALFLIDDIVEYIGYTLMAHSWNYFQQILINHVTHLRCNIRQAACYGLGILAEQTPMQVRNEFTGTQWLQCLKNALAVQKRKRQKIVSYLHCRDNIITAMGKIMRTHLNLINIDSYLEEWLNYLPLKNDIPESFTQTHFLIELISERPNLILSNNSITKTIKIITIFGEVAKEKLYTESMITPIQQCLQFLTSLDFFQRNNNQIMGGINENIKNSLVQFYQSSESSSLK